MVRRGADGELRIENASRDDALRIAQALIARGELDLADELLAQLDEVWPEDARIPFLRGLAAQARGAPRDAIAHFRAALDRDPDASRARYELARAYAALEDWDQATFHYRFVLSSDAPEPVKADVAARLVAVADARRWTTRFEAALAPSTNINVAPADAAIDPIFNADDPALLTEDSTAQSGVGARAGGGVTRQFALTGLEGPGRRVRARLGVAGSLTDYEGVRFDDTSASLLAGLRVRRRTNAFGVDARAIRRWYGGEPYEDALVARATLDRRIAAPLSLRLELSAAARDNQARDDLDGPHVRAGARVQLGLSGSAFAFAEASASRFDTDARATSYWDAGLAVGGYRDFPGGWAVQLSPGVLRREHDGPDPLFLKTRKDTRWSLSGAVIRRDVSLFGFAPFVRYRYVRNDSSLKLYDFEQHAADVGLTGVF